MECDAGIVVPLGTGKGKRRDARRPDRIDGDVEPRGLDQPARVADEGQSHLSAADTRRRLVGKWAWRPFRPGCALPAAAELPARKVADGFRGHAVGIEKALAVEMIGGRAGIGLHAGPPDGGHTDRHAQSGKETKEAATG